MMSGFAAFVFMATFWVEAEAATVSWRPSKVMDSDVTKFKDLGARLDATATSLVGLVPESPQYGTADADIKKAQAQLIHLGITGSNGQAVSETGSLDDATRAALIIFQSRNGLSTTDGSLDTGTWEALFRAFKDPVSIKAEKKSGVSRVDMVEKEGLKLFAEATNEEKKVEVEASLKKVKAALKKFDGFSELEKESASQFKTAVESLKIQTKRMLELNDWSVAANWENGKIPGPKDNVTIAKTSIPQPVVLFDISARSVNTLEVKEGAKLTVKGPTNVVTSLSLKGTLVLHEAIDFVRSSGFVEVWKSAKVVLKWGDSEHEVDGEEVVNKANHWIRQNKLSPTGIRILPFDEDPKRWRITWTEHDPMLTYRFLLGIEQALSRAANQSLVDQVTFLNAYFESPFIGTRQSKPCSQSLPTAISG
jgi:peptidoglycan hydrolase-like protein with peptidoglycan-binding domain